MICTGENIQQFNDGIFMQMKLEALVEQKVLVFASNKIGALVDSASLFDDEQKNIRRSAMIMVDERSFVGHG